ncbi:hypothetical protein IMSAGC019_03311 [Lachnospiraceae bacterium]|nr:hypothetical protein IMSAGC019_03311 [Lachnospiraceae bacterium]
MAEKNLCSFEECSVYGGNLEEETLYLMQEPDVALITHNTPTLTIVCCL